MAFKKNKLWRIIICASILSGCQGGVYQKHRISTDIPIPDSIILFIGDGMGVSQITAGKITAGRLNLERFRIMGLLTTHAQDTFVTDSAASGTAMATGEKTNLGIISMDTEKRPIKTVMEWAEARGKSTGIVVTSSVTHATPAVFVSHVFSRKDQDQIAEQMVTSGLEVLFGGGWAWFEPAEAGDSKRYDNKDLIKRLEDRMTVIRSDEAFDLLDDDHNAAALLAPEALPRANERTVSLTQMTQKAIRILSRNNKGFFLMVEGSQIDWGGHDNDPEYIISELMDFDEAVGIGLDFAKKDGHTLVVVTADHETGGFAVHDGSVDVRRVSETGFTTGGHTGAMVPLFTFGPGAEALGGIHDNTFLGKTLIQYVIAEDRR